MSTGSTEAAPGFKRVRVKLADEAKGGKRDVLFDGIKSHDADDATLASLLKETKFEQWKTNPVEGAEIGNRLYSILNGTGGKLKSILDAAYRESEPIYLNIETGPEFSALPFELIHDGGRFLLLDNGKHLVHMVSEKGWRKSSNIEKRPLKMVFMASSPTDLGTDNVLKFEEEEDRIIKATAKYPIDIKFEDSDSVEGLKDSIFEFGGCDIVHITSHADVLDDIGPVFYLETEAGYTDRVTPERLWEALKKHKLRMLFLSGCNTGKVHGDRHGDGSTESFAYRMVEKGIPVVLGWGLPVSDIGATVFTTEFYDSLGSPGSGHKGQRRGVHPHLPCRSDSRNRGQGVRGLRGFPAPRRSLQDTRNGRSF
ncbi:MAG: CHAT domain-containing protein [Nitrospirae bacterium]|nr:CHAT domain-containing protein [Nitrospirota bacterium]